MHTVLNWEGGSTNRRAVRVGVVEAGRAVPGPSASRPTVSAVDGVDLAGDGSHHRDRARSRAASFAASQSRTTNVRLLPSRLTTLLVPVIGLMGPGLLGVGPGRQRRSGPRVGVATGPPLPGRKPAPGSAAPPGHSRRGPPAAAAATIGTLCRRGSPWAALSAIVWARRASVMVSAAMVMVR